LTKAWSLRSSVEFAQLEPGRLTVTTERANLGGVTVSFSQISVGATVRGELRDGTLLLVVPATGETAGHWFGGPFTYGEIAGTSEGIELCTAGPAAFLTVALPVERVRPCFAQRAVISGSAPVRRARAALWSAMATRREHRDPLLGRFVATEVLASVTSLFDAASASAGAARALTRRVEAVRRCEAYLLQHAEGNPSLDELSEISGLRPRSLFNAFQAVTGLSPIAYLRRVRLNAVRRELQRPEAVTRRIVDIAADCGFWHMGHFTAEYRGLFGELPSDTLRQARVTA